MPIRMQELTLTGFMPAAKRSHTGVHGDNRLVSNSLLEALVFSRRAAADIEKIKSGQW